MDSLSADINPLSTLFTKIQVTELTGLSLQGYSIDEILVECQANSLPD